MIKTFPEKISLEIATRVDTISYEIIEILKEIGLKHIHLGIESFIDRDLELYSKGVTVKQNIEALSILEEFGFSTKVGSEFRVATYLISFNPLTTFEDIRTMLQYFRRYEISPKKQITFLHVSDYAPIRQKLISMGVSINANKNNEWSFLDERVGVLAEKYYDFVKHAMRIRERLRTVEKIGIFNCESEELERISFLRKNIDNKCTDFLEKLVDYYDNIGNNESIEDVYNKGIYDFDMYVVEKLEDNINQILSAVGDSCYMENL